MLEDRYIAPAISAFPPSMTVKQMLPCSGIDRGSTFFSSYGPPRKEC